MQTVFLICVSTGRSYRRNLVTGPVHDAFELARWVKKVGHEISCTIDMR
jgi:hypothetical protein